MKTIEVGATVTLFKRINLGGKPDLWRVLDVYEDTFTIAYVRKDGQVNKRRAVRNITLDDIEYIVNGNGELEPIRDDQPMLQLAPADETPAPDKRNESKTKKMPSWKTDVPVSLASHVTDEVTLPELLTTAQALILKTDNVDEIAELKAYIKKNRRFIRKPVFEW